MARATKVSIVGSGSVGSAVANALVCAELCGDLVLYDLDFARAEAEAWDISDGTPVFAAVRVSAASSFDGIADSDVVILTAGAKQHDGETRLQLLDRNSALIGTFMKELDRVAPEAVVIVVTNPVDVMTRLAMQSSDRPIARILGSGTLLDSSRLRVQLARTYGVSVSSVEVMVLGEHGDSSFAVWSSATIGCVRLGDLPIPAGRALSEMKVDAMSAVRARGQAIHRVKGFTSYGIAASLVRTVRAVVDDERAVLPVSVRAIEPYGICTEVVLSLPAVVGRSGVCGTILIALDDGEHSQLVNSARILDRAYAELPRLPAGIA